MNVELESVGSGGETSIERRECVLGPESAATAMGKDQWLGWIEEGHRRNLGINGSPRCSMFSRTLRLAPLAQGRRTPNPGPRIPIRFPALHMPAAC